jgi:hypothetical protein
MEVMNAVPHRSSTKNLGRKSDGFKMECKFLTVLYQEAGIAQEWVAG